jgi:glyoxylase-like metal-dependent hydrolase (beta-lactamase superfamily II)
MLKQVGDGVWVQQSEWVFTNSTVVRGDDGLVVVDPGIHGAELEQLADDVDRMGAPVVAGFATHPHFDHLLWHSRLGDVPRYATAGCVEFATSAQEQARAMTAEMATGVELELVAILTPLPGPVPGEIIEHDGHAVGHAAVLLADRGVLIAGDMLSDVLVPMLDPQRPGQLDAYEKSLDLLGAALQQVDVVIPGHGSIARGSEVWTRLAADRAYLDALRRGAGPVDVRLEQDWVFSGPHQQNLNRLRAG